MSTDYRSQVKCSNYEALNAIAIAIIAHCKEAALHWNDDPTQFSVKSSNYTPHQEIKAISSCFPDDVITCRYKSEINDYSEACIVEYHNGEDKELDIVPIYHYIRRLGNSHDDNGILDKVEAFCRRLDTKETDEEGNMFLNWFDEEVSYKFEYNGLDGKKYKVEATKRRDQIDLKVYENFIIKEDWRGINSSVNIFDGGAFSEVRNYVS